MTSPSRDLPIAVVTGGTRGIGAAITRRLSAAGYCTIAIARTMPEPTGPDSTADPDSTTNLAGAEVLCCDVTDADDVARTFAQIAKRGRIEVLVNNAGISTSAPIERTTLADWNQNLAVNATGPFLCTQAVVGEMKANQSGRVVTVASTAGLSGDRYIAAYAASKHAVLGLMRVVAAEVEGSGVTANSVCPTFVRTEMTIATIANIAERTGCSLDEAEAKLAQATPHGRILEIAEVADAVLDLVVSTNNGQEVLLDGGQL